MIATHARTLGLGWALFELSMLYAVPAHAQQYALTALGTLGSYANGMNNAGQVVGASITTTSGSTDATIWNGTTVTDLGPGIATAINNVGQVVGVSGGSSYENGVATLWNGSKATTLGTLGGSDGAVPLAINDAGQVAGFSYLPGNAATHATLWNGTTATDLGTLGGTLSEAFSINNAGQAVGFANVAGDTSYEATVWKGTTLTVLSSVPGSVAYAINNDGQVVGRTLANQFVLWNGTTTTGLGALDPTALNDRGQVVGSIATGDCGPQNSGLCYHAGLWEAGKVTDLNSDLAGALPPNINLTYAVAVNDNGWIVADGTTFPNANEQEFTQAYLLTPVPLPGACWLMLSGLGGLIALARRRTRAA